MALQMTVRREGYSFTEDIVTMDRVAIDASRKQFESFCKRGIIQADSYEAMEWVISNEVIKAVTISFRLNEIHFIRETGPKLNCTVEQYVQAMRIVITSRLGYGVRTLQSDSAIMRNYANTMDIPKDYGNAQLIGDLLVLLPNQTEFITKTLSLIDGISREDIFLGRKQRRLAHYQSYLRFLDLFDRFWEKASKEEKVLYFPIWFWWKITGVLPLRPTECVLTPRNCIRFQNGKYYLTVRRTRQKGKMQNSHYSIEADYEKQEYPIPEHLAKPIQEYIEDTASAYTSDIDVLFCKTTQFQYAYLVCGNDNHYTYANLRQCLDYFYLRVVQGKYEYLVVDNRFSLKENEIQRINLGDTRHLAMISLAISGGSPTICRELAGHDSIEISSHYYSNLTEFLDVLGYERYRKNKLCKEKAFGLAVSDAYPVENGFCQCEKVWAGDFSPCISAVDSNGKPGSCNVCKYYFPKRSSLAIIRSKDNEAKQSGDKDKVSVELQTTCSLLKQSVDQLRKGLGNADGVSQILDRLSAQAQRYVQASAIEHAFMESEVI